MFTSCFYVLLKFTSQVRTYYFLHPRRCVCFVFLRPKIFTSRMRANYLLHLRRCVCFVFFLFSVRVRGHPRGGAFTVLKIMCFYIFFLAFFISYFFFSELKETIIYIYMYIFFFGTNDTYTYILHVCMYVCMYTSNKCYHTRHEQTTITYLAILHMSLRRR